jgi:phosphoadenosine phosphosulfate reductase
MNKEYFQPKQLAINEAVSGFIDKGLRVFCTSSFQTQSIPLLHMLSRVEGFSNVYMTDTGFHFPETLSFAKKISRLFDLDLVLLNAETTKLQQLDGNGRFLYASDPDACCRINKVFPLDKIIPQYDIWVNGVRGDQSSARAELGEYENTKHECIRYHPMLNWTAKDIFYYTKVFDLPQHPLESEGYSSVGCEPCTVRASIEGNTRNSRWFGLTKTECGLNTDLIAKEVPV